NIVTAKAAELSLILAQYRQFKPDLSNRECQANEEAEEKLLKEIISHT
ncbi:22986_t:CDS:1, partial [Gigaspora rosea]